MIDTKKIFRDFIQNDEALDAEVTSTGVMLSEEDCLALMDRVVKKLTIPVVSTSTVYEYGAMSTKFKLVAKNKLTAYATMILHYQSNAHMMVIYTPEECKEDSWTNITGQISERLDEIFGGNDAFDKYLEKNIEEVKECYKTIEKIVG